MKATRQNLVALVEREWHILFSLLRGSPEEQMLRPGASGHWSGRDLLLHIATWEEEFMAAVPLILAGRPLPRYGNIDAFNARQQAQWQNLSLAEAWERALATHKALVRCVASLPCLPEATERRLRRRLRWDTYGHYRLHAALVRNWLSLPQA